MPLVSERLEFGALFCPDPVFPQFPSPGRLGGGAPLRLSTPTHSSMTVFRTDLSVKNAVARSLWRLVEAQQAFRDVVNSPLCLVCKGGNAFSNEFKKNDQGSTFTLV